MEHKFAEKMWVRTTRCHDNDWYTQMISRTNPLQKWVALGLPHHMLLTSMVHDSEDWLEPRESEKNTCKSCDIPMLHGNPIAVRTAHIESNISFSWQQLNHRFL